MTKDESGNTKAGSPNRREFWDRHPGLVWSNPGAPDDAFIAAALRKGGFCQILDIAVEFGVDRLRKVWIEELSSEVHDLKPSAIKRTEEVLATLEKANDRVLAARDRPPGEST